MAKFIHKCSCGCEMETYINPMGPYIDLTIEGHNLKFYGLRGKHTPDCIFYGSDLKNTFESEDAAINAWNKIFE